jgi:peptide chain release factor 2
MKFLKARLHAHYMEEERKRMEKIEQDKMDIAWGSQIRSYVLQPYTLVKDHRTNIEAGNVDAVLDGDIDLFIEGYLKSGQTVTRSESDEADNRTETE